MYKYGLLFNIKPLLLLLKIFYLWNPLVGWMLFSFGTDIVGVGRQKNTVYLAYMSVNRWENADSKGNIVKGVRSWGRAKEFPQPGFLSSGNITHWAWIYKLATLVSNWEVTKVILMSCILSAHELTTPQCPRLEKTPRPSISNVIWILSSDTSVKSDKKGLPSIPIVSPKNHPGFCTCSWGGCRSRLTICQLNQLFSNTEAALLSSIAQTHLLCKDLLI